jgi:GNAT superfamily N-acetyltransferase
MEIRFARPEDKPALIELALENQKEMEHHRISVNHQRVQEALHALFELNQGSHVLFMAETSQGQLAGILMGCVERYYYSDELQAQLVQWYVRKGFRGTSVAPRLVKAFVTWAKNRGASDVFMGISSGIDTHLTHRMMQRLGFNYLGGNYGVNLKEAGAQHHA